MRYCERCGGEIKPGERFCANCGAVVGSDSGPAQKEKKPKLKKKIKEEEVGRSRSNYKPKVEEKPVEEETPKEKKDIKDLLKLIFMIAAGVFLLTTILLGILLISKSAKAKTYLAENKKYETELKMEKTKQGIYGEMADYLASSGAYLYDEYDDYGANTNLIVVKQGENARLLVTTTDDRTLHFDNSQDSVCNVDWSRDWGEFNFTAVNIEGITPGTSTITFTKDDSDHAFTVMVVVIE